VLSWFVIMLMLDLDLCNDCNDLVELLHNFISL
jgi:hypothetical protein